MVANWYKEQPTNRNFLTPVGFKLSLELFPGVDFFCQTANIPELSMPFTTVPTPYRNVPIAASGGVDFGDLQVRFIVDEDLVNYKAIHDWIRKFGLSEGRADEKDQYSTAILEVLTSHNNTNHIVEFVRIFPVSITGVPFDATTTDIDYFTADVTFKYETYEIRTLDKQPAISTQSLNVTLTSDATGSLNPGEPFTLTYTSTGASSLSINNGVGDVELRAGAVPLNATGALDYATVVDEFTNTVTYTITATASDGSTDTASVTLSLKQPITSANRICIAVCDENLGSQTFAGMESKWVAFRTNWPDRHVYLLQPNLSNSTSAPIRADSINTLHVPPSFLEAADPDKFDL